ncbi:MAG: hypothetical protein ABI685_10830 [Ferruginibacter sp.]
MKRLTHFLLVIITVFSFCFAISANGQAKLPKWLPTDFDPKNGILLIEKANAPGQGKAQKNIEEFMAENYPYKYEFVNIGIVGDDKEPTIINAEKYTDKNVYRFIMVNSVTSIKGIPNASGHQSLGSFFDYSFIDRLNDKAYPPTGSSTSWANQAFKRIMAKIIKLKAE